MDAEARDFADLIGVWQRGSRWLVQALRIAQRSFDQMVHDRDGDVGQKQTGNGLVDAAPMPQRTDRADPQAADQGGRQRHDDDGRGPGHLGQGNDQAAGRQTAERDRALSTDDDQAKLGGQGHAQGGEQQRGRLRQRVLPGERRAERGLEHELVELHRVPIDQHQEHGERPSARRSGRTRAAQRPRPIALPGRPTRHLRIAGRSRWRGWYPSQSARGYGM